MDGLAGLAVLFLHEVVEGSGVQQVVAQLVWYGAFLVFRCHDMGNKFVYDFLGDRLLLARSSLGLTLGHY